MQQLEAHRPLTPTETPTEQTFQTPASNLRLVPVMSQYWPEDQYWPQDQGTSHTFSRKLIGPVANIG